ncbi:MAG: hypothetical protein NTU41_00335 [Chloroflexi bacterium]|nr:hypothetical protein [Chloroflexota bacterium]
MTLRKTMSTIEPSAKHLSHKVISFEVKVIDKYVPDKVLLFTMNVLDRRIPPKVIYSVVDGVSVHLPDKVRSSVITAADEYVPDAVANSRKICAVLAGVGKYIPDRVIPPASVEKWDSVKLRFHIPTLVTGKPEDAAAGQ